MSAMDEKYGDALEESVSQFGYELAEKQAKALTEAMAEAYMLAVPDATKDDLERDVATMLAGMELGAHMATSASQAHLLRMLGAWLWLDVEITTPEAAMASISERYAQTAATAKEVWDNVLSVVSGDEAMQKNLAAATRMIVARHAGPKEKDDA